MNENGWSAAQANTYIGILLPIRSMPQSKSTVDRWFNESQLDPIPDNELELLTLKVKLWNKQNQYTKLVKTATAEYF